MTLNPVTWLRQLFVPKRMKKIIANIELKIGSFSSSESLLRVKIPDRHFVNPGQPLQPIHLGHLLLPPVPHLPALVSGPRHRKIQPSEAVVTGRAARGQSLLHSRPKCPL